MTLADPAIQAAIGVPFGQEGLRQRPIGRIGGFIGNPDPETRERLTAALGANAQILDMRSPTESVAADYDACWLDGRRLESDRQWQAVMQAGRLAEVRGAFVVAWIGADGSLVLARDAIGERSLFYACLPDGIVFASSLHAILATRRVARSLHLPSVASYLAYAYIPGRETLVEGVYEVLPGEVVHYHNGILARHPFWAVPAEQSPREEEELLVELRAQLEGAVQRRLPQEAAVGAFLSGGLDSSLVVAIARSLHPQPVHTYSISFGAGHANELAFSSEVASHCKTKHRIVELPAATVLHHLDDSVRLFSKPNGDPLTTPNALLFREAASEVGVILNGEGGDPCFGGPKNLPMLLADLYGGILDRESVLMNRAQNYLRAHLKCYDDLPTMLSSRVLDALAQAPLENGLFPYFEDPRWKTYVNRLQAMNIIFKGGHHILSKVDAVSAPFGMLPRSPLFDQALVELSFEIPARLKLKGSVEKYLLKQAVRDLLPGSIIERPKSGMLVPVEAWFQGPMLARARERLLDGLAPMNLVEKGYLEKLLDGNLGGVRPRRGAKLWLLVTLESWLRTVFEDCD